MGNLRDVTDWDTDQYCLKFMEQFLNHQPKGIFGMWRTEILTNTASSSWDSFWTISQRTLFQRKLSMYSAMVTPQILGFTHTTNKQFDRMTSKNRCKQIETIPCVWFKNWTQYLPYYFHTSHNFQYFVLGVFRTSVYMSSFFFQSPERDMRHSNYFLFQTLNDYHAQPPALMPEPFLNPAPGTLQTILSELVRKVSERDRDPATAVVPEPFLNPVPATLQTVLSELVRKVSERGGDPARRSPDPWHRERSLGAIFWWGSWLFTFRSRNRDPALPPIFSPCSDLRSHTTP